MNQPSLSQARSHSPIQSTDKIEYGIIPGMFPISHDRRVGRN